MGRPDPSLRCPSQWPLIARVACLTLLAAQPARAQFATILNIPPDPNIGNNQRLGSDTQLNLSDGGSIGRGFYTGAVDGSSTNVEVNIHGGDIGPFFTAAGESTVSIIDGTVGDDFFVGVGSSVIISGGLIGNHFAAGPGSTVIITGGSIGDRFGGDIDSDITLVGSEFYLDAERLVGFDMPGDRLALHLQSGSLLTGTFADGTGFAFLSSDGDSLLGLIDPILTLEAATLPPIGPAVIEVPFDSTPRAVREGQTLIVSPGGELNNHFNAGRGSTVRIAGGSVGENFEAVAAQVEITGGSIGDNFDAFDGATLHISGGAVGDDIDIFNGSTVVVTGGSVGNGVNAFDGSVVTISGGSVGFDFSANDGSSVDISGGSVGTSFVARFGSIVNISGGIVGENFFAFGGEVAISGGAIGDDFDSFGGSVNLTGGDFRLDGVLIEGLETVGTTLAFDVPSASTLSGTLADGTPFAFSGYDADSFKDGTLSLEAAVLPSVGPAVIDVSNQYFPLLGVRGGQTLVVREGGVLNDHFNAGWGSTVQVIGGQVGDNFESLAAEITISGGSVGDDFDAFLDSTVDITGGSLGHGANAFDGSTVNISGGSVGYRFSAFHGSTVNITGGSVGPSFDARDGSTVSISGGSVGEYFEAYGGSTINIAGGSIGSRFTALDGSAVNISGGAIGGNFLARDGSNITVTGGSFDSFFLVLEGGAIAISGGSFGDEFIAFPESSVSLLGAQFLLDGVDITSALTLNDPFTIVDRDVTLSGLLADGSPFSFDLNSTNLFGEEDYFDPNATLTVTLILPGDFNMDGAVDALDYAVWREGLGTIYNAAHYDIWAANYGATPPPEAISSSTPEPVSGLILSMLVSSARLRIRR